MSSEWKSSRVFICGTTRNCGEYIEPVFKNIERIGTLFSDYRIIIAFDHSADDTLLKLTQQKRLLGDKLDILINRDNLSSHRTQNISNARNMCLTKMRNVIASGFTADYFIMMDMDDVNVGRMDFDVFDQVMEQNHEWDSVSFNRYGYYDLWALSIDEYVYSCWGWHNSWEIVERMREYIIDKLKKTHENEFVACRSAFNGLAVYKTDAFIDINYDWLMPKEYMTLQELLHQKHILGNCETYSPLDVKTHEPDCEHRAFHMRAIAKNSARIRISPKIFVHATEA
jgi:hypothetical protein